MRVLYDFGYGLAMKMGGAHDSITLKKLKKHLEKKPPSELTLEEKLSLEHIRLHEEHEGHESMHAEMVIILLSTLIIAQIVLFLWKKKHYKSYQPVTLLGMWLTPLVLSVKNHWWRFVFVWLVFSCVTGIVFKKSLQKPIERHIPRLVYKYFYYIYRFSYITGIAGYSVLISAFFGLHLFFPVTPQTWMDMGMLLVFYGLYYGVLGRDIAEICTDKMAVRIGYYNAHGMPTRNLDANVCAVCGDKLYPPVTGDEDVEFTYKLTCNHTFHELCIRGWCIVGKKQTCPYCKEKVDLKKMFRNPWERPHMLYGQLLDLIRYLVSWQPLILFLVQGINWALGLE